MCVSNHQGSICSPNVRLDGSGGRGSCGYHKIAGTHSLTCGGNTREEVFRGVCGRSCGYLQTTYLT